MVRSQSAGGLALLRVIIAIRFHLEAAPSKAIESINKEKRLKKSALYRESAWAGDAVLELYAREFCVENNLGLKMAHQLVRNSNIELLSKRQIQGDDVEVFLYRLHKSGNVNQIRKIVKQLYDQIQIGPKAPDCKTSTDLE